MDWKNALCATNNFRYKLIRYKENVYAVDWLPPLLRYYRTTYHSLPALNRRLTKEEQEELIFQKNL